MWHNVGLTLLVFVATLLIVLLLMVCETSLPMRIRICSRFPAPASPPQLHLRSSGWYFVWHLFLSKFKFLRELVGDTGSQEGDHELSGSETEEDTSSSPHRIRSARQRRAPADEGH
ncbi:small integral membrane protein 13 isoform X1 [Eulemur rufifrons]|uniref:small integral membrane protein 13 isoform X1 n=1 Tax=Eulemur rufifrons TaxID=859984 RepID=UPI0037422590